MDDRGHLVTELRNARSSRLDTLSTAEAFDLINSEDATVAGAVAAAREDICRAIDLVVDAFQAGGRLVYVGAGTSGRLGVIDAAECPPTFLTDPEMVRAVIAGGTDAISRSVEGAEDSPEGGAAAMDDHRISAPDVVLGIASGGTTPFVHGALCRARQRGARTVFFACVPQEQAADEADVSIRVLTGPEVLTGSTRLKAGTATKMVLNMVTTIAMVRLGKTLGNLMIDVNAGANRKLIDRAVRMIRAETGLSRQAARGLLDSAGGRVKTALVMHATGEQRGAAERLLREANGHLGVVMASPSPAFEQTEETT